MALLRAAGGGASLALFGCAVLAELVLGGQQLTWPGAIEPVPATVVAALLSSAGMLVASWPALHWSAWRPVVPVWRIDVAVLLGSAGLHAVSGLLLQLGSGRVVLWGWLAVGGLALLGLAATGRALGGLAVAGTGVMVLTLLPVVPGQGVVQLLRVQAWFAPLAGPPAHWFCAGVLALGLACALLRVLGRGRHGARRGGKTAGSAAPAPLGSTP
ncbi:hypothetical protein [Promicromonospora sp. NPDC057488]|uniref:hypothetical protein n=1 Tax=Promicromonospora sp. NPDC057488 TaxID=3346147 RepID=UPI00366EDD02